MGPAFWWSCLSTHLNNLNNFSRKSLKEPLCKIIFKLGQYFWSRRFLQFSLFINIRKRILNTWWKRVKLFPNNYTNKENKPTCCWSCFCLNVFLPKCIQLHSYFDLLIMRNCYYRHHVFNHCRQTSCVKLYRLTKLTWSWRLCKDKYIYNHDELYKLVYISFHRVFLKRVCCRCTTVMIRLILCSNK